MEKNILNIVLADDDIDDCLFFEEAIENLAEPAKLTTVHNGEQLMQYLHTKEKLPDVLFLDLNMPRKNGFQCLVEIKLDERLKQLPVVIFTTAFDDQIIYELHSQGAHYFIRKPNTFDQLRSAIHEVLHILKMEDYVQPIKEKFILNI